MSNERDVTSGMETALQARTVRPVLVGRLDILTDPITAWTGPGVFAPSSTGDAALDGQIFGTMAPFLEMSNILEDQGIGGPVQLMLTGHDLDETALQQIVKDKRQWRGRGAWLWMGLLNSDEATVVANPLRVKTGIMTSFIVHRTKDMYSVTVIIDRDLGNAKSAPFRWIDHARIIAGDTWSTFVITLANKPKGFESTRVEDYERREDRGPRGPGRERR